MIKPFIIWVHEPTNDHPYGAWNPHYYDDQKKAEKDASIFSADGHQVIITFTIKSIGAKS